MRSPVVLLIGTLICAACSSPTDQQKNVATARALFEAFNQHDWQAMAALYAEPAEMLDPAYGPEPVTKTRHDIVSNYTQMQTMFPDIRDSVTHVYPSGDHVIVTFISTGSAPAENGEVMQFATPIVTILTFKDGLIVHDATYYDL